HHVLPSAASRDEGADDRVRGHRRLRAAVVLGDHPRRLPALQAALGITPMGNAADAAHAILALAAEDMFQDVNVFTPLPDPRLTAEGWHIRGYLTAVDAVRGIGNRLYYGFVAEQPAAPGLFVAVVRGTERFIEWVIDAEFLPTPHPLAGQVETGFYGVYQTMEFMTLDGRPQPLIGGLLGAFGLSAHVTVVGHSLGAAVATFLALDLSKDKGHGVAVRLFASPRPGNYAFTSYFDSAIADCVSYDYEPDLVPDVPLGYATLASAVVPPRNTAIPDNPLDNHHAGNYSWLLDPATAEAA